jgi:hypothetical protein
MPLQPCRPRRTCSGVFTESRQPGFDAEQFAEQPAEDQAADDDQQLPALQGQLQTDQRDGQSEPRHQGGADSVRQAFPEQNTNRCAAKHRGDVDKRASNDHSMTPPRVAAM